MSRLVPIVALSACLAGCGYRPARFADAPPVTRVLDDKSVPLPRARTFISELYEADVYVRRELSNALDPRRTADSADVSSHDQVPASSWFAPPANQAHPLRGYTRDGAPQLPYRWLDEPAASGAPDARVVEDARGLRYELQGDLPQRPGMRTGAVVIASRLLGVLGYRTPEVHLVVTRAGARYAAMRWPIGIDLGPTPIARLRDDDPNDRVDHRDRRTLRALQLVTAWLGVRRLRPRMLRDVYVGASGHGHVQHHLVGWDGALGAGAYQDAVKWAQNPDREDSNFFLKLFSMGLSPKPPGLLPTTPYVSVGLLSERLVVAEHDLSPPFEPSDRLLGADSYWIAKQMHAISRETLAAAILAARLGDEEQNWLLQVLELRRAGIVAHAYDLVSPLEVVSVEPRRLVLVDLAVSSGMTRRVRSSYLVRFLDEEGSEVRPPLEVADPRAVAVPLAAGPGYLVVQVLAKRNGVPLPRPCEAHLLLRGGSYRLVGVRH